MGVSHYKCDNCGTTFADCEDDATWCDCGGRFCCKECAQKDEQDSCCLCRYEVVRDEKLLSFLLKHCQLTHEQALTLYRDSKK
jgi:hypothetical protein